MNIIANTEVITITISGAILKNIHSNARHKVPITAHFGLFKFHDRYGLFNMANKMNNIIKLASIVTKNYTILFLFFL